MPFCSISSFSSQGFIWQCIKFEEKSDKRKLVSLILESKTKQNLQCDIEIKLRRQFSGLLLGAEDTSDVNNREQKDKRTRKQ